MSVVKLTSEHTDQLTDLFGFKKIMGSDIISNEYEYFKSIGYNKDFAQLIFDNFRETYLSGLNSFHAFGYVEDDKVKATISFYECNDEPSWYYTGVFGSGNRDYLTKVFDKIIEYNESNSRYKFFTSFSTDHAKLQRRLYWSKYNSERYGYFDEYILPKRTKCIYEKHWKLLFNQILLPNDAVVRCNYLKPEHRHITLAGNI
jgi:hypothetical protein